MPVYHEIFDGPGRNHTRDGHGRPIKARKRYIALHNTSNRRLASAKDEASYAKRRTDSVGSHYYVDRLEVRQSMDTDWCAWHAASGKGNREAIAYEITGWNSHNRAWWLANVAWVKVATQIAKDCRAHNIEARALSDAEIAAGRLTGFITHLQMTRVWGGDHTDPGPGFPMDHLVALVRARLRGVADDQEDEMRLIHGQVPVGPNAIIVCTPWEKSAISFGCDLGSGKARLRVAEHQVNGGWRVSDIVISSSDAARKDLPGRANIDRRSILRLPLDENDALDTPVGYVAWW